VHVLLRHGVVCGLVEDRAERSHSYKNLAIHPTRACPTHVRPCEQVKIYDMGPTTNADAPHVWTSLSWTQVDAHGRTYSISVRINRKNKKATGCALFRSSKYIVCARSVLIGVVAMRRPNKQGRP
jgi:hypothetical protein